MYDKLIDHVLESWGRLYADWIDLYKGPQFVKLHLSSYPDTGVGNERTDSWYCQQMVNHQINWANIKKGQLIWDL